MNAIILRKVDGVFTACRRGVGLKPTAIHTPMCDRMSLIGTALVFALFLAVPLLLAAVAAVITLGHPVAALVAIGGKSLPLIGLTATGFPSASSATTVTTLADLYEKANTTVKTAIRLGEPETGWRKRFPKEKITVSGNENRIPLILNQPTGVTMLAEGGNEAIMSTPAPTHGTFMPVQMNKRFGITGLAQALTNRARAAMIEEQVPYQAAMAGAAFSRAIGLQFWGQSTGTVAVVSATNSSGTVLTDIALKNAFGSSLIPATSTAQKTYLSSLFRVGERVALIRSSAVVEFGTVVASPAVSAGVGYVDITFAATCQPTANDLIVFANADQDITITGTDVNNWAVGLIEILVASGVHSLTTAAAPAWAAGSASTTAQRASFQVKEKLINEVANASGMKVDRIAVSQGVRRDVIAGERGARRYDSAEMDLEGDLKGFQYLTSPLTPPGFMVGWYSQAYSTIELSDQPEQEMSKSSFSLDKVQGKSQVAASYDWFYQNICSARSAFGYASSLAEQ